MLRFLAAILVLSFHYCFLMEAAPGGLVARAGQGVIKFSELNSYTNFGWVGVEIFFVISGFVIAFSGEKSTPFSFLRSRIVRLGPAVWLCAPLTLVATILVGFRSNEEMYRAFRHSMAFLPWNPWIDGSYWTLGIELAFYFAVFVLIKFAEFKHIKLLAAVIGVASTLFWTASFTAGSERFGAHTPQLEWLIGRRVSELLLLRHGMFFSLGVFLWAELVKKHEVKNILWILAFCIAGCIQIISETIHVNTDLHVAYSALAPCLIWLASVLLIVVSVRSNAYLHAMPTSVIEAIQIAGMMTYPLYLLHQIVGGAMMGWMVLHGVERWVALAATVLIIFVMTWIIATRAEPWLQRWTRYLITDLHDRYRMLWPRLVK
jgi:peptidoglycan/LPS O-acetylase OafA/YrhL